MLRVLIDATNVSSKPTGAGLFTQHICAQLASNTNNLSLSILISRSLPAAHPLRQISGVRFVERSIPPIGVRRDIFLAWYVYRARGEFDVFYCCMPYLPLWYAPRNACITVHDLGYLHFPGFFRRPWHRWYFHAVLRHALACAAHIFTVSRSSRDDIVRFFPFTQHKPITIISESSALGESTAMGTAPARPYILFVGERRPHKNLENLIRAFALVAPQQPQVDLRIVGKDHAGYTQKLTNVIQELKLSERVILSNPTGVGEGELKMLYQNATALALVSYYEGFGLPLVEAMESGLPIVAARASALPEVAGEAAVYVNPADPADIAAKLLQVITNQPLRQKLVAAGFERRKLFSWKNSAGVIAQTLAQLYAGGK